MLNNTFLKLVTEFGQTYFLGDQPVHVHFFRPNYRPRFAASDVPCQVEHVVIGKDLVEKYALQELGFQYHLDDTGAYILDCQLSAVSLIP